jgi:chorismate dehydratase
MQKVITEDESVTFRNKKYDECYHTKSGAIEEAFEKYAKPCKVKNGMKILDVCFGIGYNTLAAIHMADVKVVGLENDIEILKKVQEIEVSADLTQDYEKIRKAAKDFEYKDRKVSIRIILGDARKTIKEVNEKFDAVFLDPFSPKKCPELWTADFFFEIKKRMKKGAVLATYSCARIVRDNLKKAGFRVEDGPVVGRRSPSTLGYS